MDSKDMAVAHRELLEYRDEYFQYWDSTAKMTETGTVYPLYVHLGCSSSSKEASSMVLSFQ